MNVEKTLFETDGVVVESQSDLETIYIRHMYLFLLLLSFDFFVQANYLYMFLTLGEESAGTAMDQESLGMLYRTTFGVMCAYCTVYYYWVSHRTRISNNFR